MTPVTSELAGVNDLCVGVVSTSDDVSTEDCSSLENKGSQAKYGNQVK
jgi:hypothetical protein